MPDPRSDHTTSNIYGQEATLEFLVKFNPTVNPNDLGRYMAQALKDLERNPESTSITTAGFRLQRIEEELRFWVDPVLWWRTKNV